MRARCQRSSTREGTKLVGLTPEGPLVEERRPLVLGREAVGGLGGSDVGEEEEEPGGGGETGERRRC